MTDRLAFIRFAASFEAAIGLIAAGLGLLAGIRPTGLVPDWRSAAAGLLATGPMIGFYVFATRVPLRPFRRIHDLLLATLGKPLAECRWHELLLLAALAGLCEEVLFRGVLQPWLGRFGAPVGWVAANVLFGLAHAVTPTYFLLAAAIGLYLSGVQWLAGGDLAAPVLAHGLYDLFAFVQIARHYRRHAAGEAGEVEPADGRG